MHHKLLVEISGFILSFVTMLLLFWYTLETFKLRKESQKQTDALWRPLLDLDGNSPWIISNFPLKLLNLGKGIAKNITGYLILNSKKYKLYFSKFGDNGMIENYGGMGYLEFFKEGIEVKIKEGEYEEVSQSDVLFLKYENINSKIYKTEITKENCTKFLELK